LSLIIKEVVFKNKYLKVEVIRKDVKIN